MKKFFIFLVPFLFCFCSKYEQVSSKIKYIEFQSSIDPSFNYIEDIKDWEGVNKFSE